MTNITLQEGQFRIDGQAIFLHAAEVHYYRSPKEVWRQRLQLLKDAGFNTLATYIPWIWHQTEEGSTDFDGQSHPMRDLRHFLDLAAEMGFWLIPRPGPYIMAETINEGIPKWVFANHPECAFINQHKQAENIVSYLHPSFLSCVEAWYREIFKVISPRQITKGGKVILVQLDNEMGMIPWVRNIVDVNPHTMDKFASYLRDRYGEKIKDRYLDENLVLFLTNQLCQPDDVSGEQVLMDYMDFYRLYLKEYTEFLWNTAKKNGMDVPPVINIHGFGNGGKTFPIGLSQLVDVMGIDGMVSATDVYPLHIDEGNFHHMLMVNEMTKALQNKDQALFSIEFQSGGNSDFGGTQSSMYDLHARLNISCGMRAINHYLFTAGENDPVLSPVKRHDWGPPIRNDGTVRNHYHRYPKLSAMINTYGRSLVESTPEVDTTIGFLIDEFQTEYENRYTRPQAEILKHQRNDIQFDMIGRCLSILHHSFNAVEVSRSELSASTFPLIWMMVDKVMPDGVQKKLVDYVEEGGKLVLIGRMPERDREGVKCTRLKEFLRIDSLITEDPWKDSMIHAMGYRDIPSSFKETYEGKFDEVIATDDQGGIVGFSQSIKKGQVLHLGASFSTSSLDDIDVIERIAHRMGCISPFKLDKWLDVRISRHQDGNFLFFNNYQDDPISTKVEYRGTVLFDHHAITLPARFGVTLPLDWKVDEKLTIRYCTSEIRKVLEANDTLVMEFATPGVLSIQSGFWRFNTESLSEGKTIDVDQTITFFR